MARSKKTKKVQKQKQTQKVKQVVKINLGEAKKPQIAPRDMSKGIEYPIFPVYPTLTQGGSPTVYNNPVRYIQKDDSKELVKMFEDRFGDKFRALEREHEIAIRERDSRLEGLNDAIRRQQLEFSQELERNQEEQERRSLERTQRSRDDILRHIEARGRFDELPLLRQQLNLHQDTMIEEMERNRRANERILDVENRIDQRVRNIMNVEDNVLAIQQDVNRAINRPVLPSAEVIENARRPVAVVESSAQTEEPTRRDRFNVSFTKHAFERAKERNFPNEFLEEVRPRPQRIPRLIVEGGGRAPEPISLFERDQEAQPNPTFFGEKSGDPRIGRERFGNERANLVLSNLSELTQTPFEEIRID